MKDVEILAPAGSLESLYGALKLGADAVYTGTSRFGARAFADNPSVTELEKALTYAHLRGKKIYLTVNTLLNDRELEEELFPMIQPLYEAGLDACIVQDMGVLSFLHENFPDMDLHASTQMTLFSGEEANLYKPYGVTRYVPARELTIEEIRQARKQTDMEIEVFVHGALCYCYSGQCLMSQEIGGRSGNRGMCAQPCRLPFSSEYGNGYLLNTKDNCTLFHIPELVEAGIDSFKIEGRMKKKEYSAFLSYVYRKYTDLYQERGKGYFEELRENRNSELWEDYKYCMDLYNRGGFSRSYLFEENKADIIYPTKNGHFGTLVGEVIKAGKGKAEFLTKEEIRYQDILEFRDDKDEKVYEYTVKDGAGKKEKVVANVMKGSRIYPGQKVYRTRNASLLAKINDEIEAVCDNYPLQGELTGNMEEPVKLTITDGKTSICVEGAIVQKADNRPVTEEMVAARLGQLGSTDYVFSTLTVSLPENAFLPLGSLKELRRNGLALWEEKATLRRHSKKALEKHKDSTNWEYDTIISVNDEKQLRVVCDMAGKETLIHVKLVGFLPETWEAVSTLLQGRRVAISFPQILHGEKLETFRKNWEQYGHVFQNIDAVVVNSHRMYLFAKEWWPDVKWYADTNMYQENERAKEAYREMGMLPVPETVYGRKQVMITEGCVQKTLSRCGKGEQVVSVATPKGDRFLVQNHCQYCFNTIYTDKPLQKKGDFVAKRIDFTVEDEKEVRKVMKEWNI